MAVVRMRSANQIMPFVFTHFYEKNTVACLKFENNGNGCNQSLPIV